MVMERIPAGSWQQHAGHVARYQYAVRHARDGESHVWLLERGSDG